jgi:integral membrane protein
MTDFQKVRLLRIVGVTEGISFFVLLLIAMPFKYFFGMPQLVTVVGWIHGALFITYLGAVLIAAPVVGYSLFKTAIAWVAALVPIGTFILDKEWRSCEDELEAKEKAA